MVREVDNYGALKDDNRGEQQASLRVHDISISADCCKNQPSKSTSRLQITLLTSVNLANQVISDVCGRLEATTNSEATLASNAVIASDILSCRGKSSEG